MLSNTTRAQWEDALFGNAYKGANGFDRCKYGVLNMLRDINGVKCCSTYGRSYKKERILIKFIFYCILYSRK